MSHIRERMSIILMAALALSSCATRIPYRKAVDAAALFPEGAFAYIRLDKALLSEAVQGLVAPEDLRSARAFLNRTDRATAALFLLGQSDAGEEKPFGPETLEMSLYGLAEGSYPAGAATFRLRLSREWHKEGRALVNRSGTLRLAFADSKLLAAGTGDLDPLLDHLSSPGPHPVPEDLRPLWETEGALWLPKPVTVLQALMGPDAPVVPARAALLSLSSGPESGTYKGFWVFEFADDRSARVFGPLCRLVHLAWIRATYGPDSNGADRALAETIWKTAGNRVRASGFTVRGKDLFSAFAREP